MKKKTYVIVKIIAYRLYTAFDPFMYNLFFQAVHARDALAKSVYERVFNWLVKRLNHTLQSTEPGRKTLLGILDIYGFEIFNKNG